MATLAEFSLARGRRLLARSVAGESAASDLSRFFAPEVAQQIRLAEGDIASVRCEGCHAAILITDLRGFTALSHGRSAQELIGLLGEYQARLVPIIQRHGGSIDKYLGDGILASFGDGGRQPGEFFAVHSIATDSKGNIYTTETYEGKRVQKFVYMGLGPVEKENQGVVWPAPR